MKIYTFNLQTYKQFGTIQNMMLISIKVTHLKLTHFLFTLTALL